jgi:quinone-reactive Ni/Fe-hydrogenase large subunit
MSLALFIQDHVVHFYHLHLLDFVDVTKALDADPKMTSKTGHLYCDEPYRNSHAHYIAVKEKLAKFVKSGRLGPFSNGYWGHSDYKFSPEENLLLLSHYLEALNIMKEAKGFIDRAYLPDMKLLATVYKEEIKAASGRSIGNFLSVGGYAFDKENQLFEDGVIYDHDFDDIKEFDEHKITEEVERAWYKDDKPYYTDLNEDGTLKTAKPDDKYSWIKANRWRVDLLQGF